MIQYTSGKYRHGPYPCAINPSSDLGVLAQLESTTQEPWIDCTDTTARYIEKLEELIGIAKWVGNSDFGARSQQAKYIITYAEGKQDD